MPHTHLLHTQMIEAIEAQNISKVKELMAQGVQVNYINNSCASSAIEAATKLGDLEMVTLLLSVKKADPNRWYTSNPLTIAIDKGFLDIAHLLIERGADVNIDPEIDMTPLVVAVYANNFQLVKKLVERGADVKAVGSQSSIALSVAASNGYKEIYDYLLPLVNPNSLDEFLDEAVWFAIEENSLVGIEFLASVNANLNCGYFNGDTPL